MSRKNGKSSGLSGWTLLATAIGVGIGYGVNKLIEVLNEDNKE